MLKIGRKAPSFKLQDQDDKTRTLKEFVGELDSDIFYPKDDTPGCTKEACAITDVYKDFKRQKVAVLGVSKDGVKSHKKFAEKYSLPFTLLSDPTMDMMAKYGVVVEKQKGEKVTKSTQRVSYLVDREGKIAKVYEKVDPANHALEIIADIKQVLKDEKKAAKAAVAAAE